MKLFELFATLSLDTREFERNMRNVTKQGSGFAGTMERQLTAGTVALGNLAADAAKSVAGAVTGIIRDAFSLTGELEQNIGGAEAVFSSTPTLFTQLTTTSSSFASRSGWWTSCWYCPTPIAFGSILTSSASGSWRRRPIEIAPRTVRSRSGNSARAVSLAE